MKQNPHRFKQRFIIALALFIIVVGWLDAFIIRTYLSAHYVAAYPFIPLFFFLCGLVFVALVHRAEQRGENLVRMVMVFKSARILASMVILGLCALFARDQLFDFAITYLVFYVLYLIFEMVALYIYEKDRKKQRNGQS